MNGIFDFLFDIGNYEERKVARYEDEHLIVDTAAVSDGEKPYETGIEHPEYNMGKWIIVEAYGTKEEAQSGHNKWVNIMQNEPLPKILIDCQNAFVSKLCDDLKFRRKKLR